MQIPGKAAAEESLVWNFRPDQGFRGILGKLSRIPIRHGHCFTENMIPLNFSFLKKYLPNESFSLMEHIHQRGDGDDDTDGKSSDDDHDAEK